MISDVIKEIMNTIDSLNSLDYYELLIVILYLKDELINEFKRLYGRNELVLSYLIEKFSDLLKNELKLFDNNVKNKVKLKEINEKLKQYNKYKNDHTIHLKDKIKNIKSELNLFNGQYSDKRNRLMELIKSPEDELNEKDQEFYGRFVNTVYQEINEYISNLELYELDNYKEDSSIIYETLKDMNKIRDEKLSLNDSIKIIVNSIESLNTGLKFDNINFLSQYFEIIEQKNDLIKLETSRKIDTEKQSLESEIESLAGSATAPEATGASK